MLTSISDANVKVYNCVTAVSVVVWASSMVVATGDLFNKEMVP